MIQFPRAGVVLAISASLALSACNQTDADKPAAAETAGSSEAAAEGAVKIDGLPTEKEQVSYMIGRDVARSLEEVKDELDVKVLVDALQSGLAGEDSKMTEEQVTTVREAFAQRIQAERIAEMMAAAKKNKEAGAEFLAANKAKPGVETTESGLQYQVITKGDGPKPTAEDVVRVHYKGTLLNGETFDSSYERNEPAVFALPQVVPGWQEGIALMPVGSKYRFWIPSELGYGEQGTPGGPIGPNEVLVFEVELQDIVERPAQ
ncbi:FKBP-type peptidyl-prolyl cis-trans isomerase [Novilysobacter arseniciresistens]|uniref:FKBP-type peptidyl-prolyl cis-trans isomerase n=1 Tax=Novilysobacter arseniciresistens TaxID=1385522 RepID=UPI00068B90D8|nr:FKBP-type peptidyl-prolyl cis-trans isomerase [Lysobacter arseniciresistens]